MKFSDCVKRTMAVAGACATLITAAVPTTFAAMNPAKISVADARTVLRLAVKLDKTDSITADELSLADMDFDGAISVSDARSMLRLAVKLDSINGLIHETEYDVFSSGYFKSDVEIATADAAGKLGDAATFSVSFTGNEMALSGDFFGMMGGADTDDNDKVDMSELTDYFGEDGSMKLIFSGDKVSILVEGEEDDNVALVMNADEMGDESGSLVSSLRELIVGSSMSLDKAFGVTEETVDGKKCKVYSFNEIQDGAKYVRKVYMNGKKLVRIDDMTSAGVLVSRMTFKNFTRCVATSDFAVPADYEVVDMDKIIKN